MATLTAIQQFFLEIEQGMQSCTTLENCNEVKPIAFASEAGSRVAKISQFWLKLYICLVCLLMEIGRMLINNFFEGHSLLGQLFHQDL